MLWKETKEEFFQTLNIEMPARASSPHANFECGRYVVLR